MGCDIREKFGQYEHLRDVVPGSFDPLNALVDLETCVRDVYGITENIREEVDLVLKSEFGFTIDEFLADLHGRFEAVLSSAHTPEDLFDALNVGVAKNRKVIIPTNGGRKIEPGVESFVRPRMNMDKLRRFFRVLREINISSSDIKVQEGMTFRNMIRPGSYYYIEIPSLGKTVLINPYERERTRILPSIRDFDTIAESTKDELEEDFGAILVPWIASEEGWNHRVGKAITDSEAGMENWDRAEWINRFKEKHSAEELMEMSFRKKRYFTLYGVSLRKVCRIITGDSSLRPVENSMHLAQMLLKIFGPGVPCVEKSLAGLECASWDQKRWAVEFLQYFPTAEDFLSIGHKKRRAFDIGGNKLVAVCSAVIGESVGDISCTAARKKFVLNFYGISEDDYRKIVIKLRLKEDGGKIAADVNDRDYYIEQFKKEFPEPQKFMGLSDIQAAKVKIGPTSLLNAARLIAGRDLAFIVTNRYQRMILMEAVYGADNEVVEKCRQGTQILKTDEFEIGEAALQFLKNYPDPESFMKENVLKVRDDSCGDVTLYTLMKTVSGGEWGSNIRNKKMMAQFARILYGEGHECIDSVLWTREEWIERVRTDFPTREKFMSMTSKEKVKRKIAKKGLTGLMRLIVGRRGTPTTSTADMSEMADIIYSSKTSSM